MNKSIKKQIENDYGELEGPALDALTKARERKDISRVAMIEELKRRDILAETYDVEADAEIIEDENSKLMEFGGTMLNLENEPDDDDDDATEDEDIDVTDDEDIDSDE